MTDVRHDSGGNSFISEESPRAIIDRQQTRALIANLLAKIGSPNRVLLLPPDYTRYHSGAGELTVELYENLKDRARIEIMPALGTHAPMTETELATMFPGIPTSVFRVHDWRRDLIQLGRVPAAFVREISNSLLDFPITCEINRRLVEGRWDSIISIGQLVPHEVAGIANHSKNIFVGAGGRDTINKTHFLGAVCNMEKAMGRADTPVRAVLEYMRVNFTADLPITYLLTVRALDESGTLVTRGLFAGSDDECFRRGAALCQQVNLNLLDQPIRKAIVYLDPDEYKSTWLGNKAVYRTRMAMADDGELIIIAPGVATFGEDPEIDHLIRVFGYRGTRHTLRMVEQHQDLAANLSAAAHLIHGSSENRFKITYSPGGLSRREIEAAGFEFADPAELQARYNPTKLNQGWNEIDGKNVFFITNPGLGLWALRSKFEKLNSPTTPESGDAR